MQNEQKMNSRWAQGSYLKWEGDGAAKSMPSFTVAPTATEAILWISTASGSERLLERLLAKDPLATARGTDPDTCRSYLSIGRAL
jgi:hypothetical protein